MTLSESVSSVFSKYASFSGRASRSEYWYFVLFNILVGVAAGLIEALVSQDLGEAISGIYSLAALLPGIAVAIRRLHDTGRGGQWLFIALIPLVGAIWLMVIYCEQSQPGPNRFGDVPEN